MLKRILIFTHFTLTEYVRSGRILVELAATSAFWTIFFRDYGLVPVTLEQFFSLSSIFTLLLTLYSVSSLLSLSERPQSYLLLTRPLGRSGYLLGLYVATLIMVGLMFGILVGLTLIFNRPLDFAWLELLKGALPLLLNVALFASLMVLLSPLVLANSLRLLILALLAIALYSQAWHLWPFFRFIEPLQSLLSWPIYPALRGFQLATTRDFSGGNIYVPLAQFGLAFVLLLAALASFRGRDIILHDQ
jgi:hypothetical protein